MLLAPLVSEAGRMLWKHGLFIALNHNTPAIVDEELRTEEFCDLLSAVAKVNSDILSKANFQLKTVPGAESSSLRYALDGVAVVDQAKLRDYVGLYVDGRFAGHTKVYMHASLSSKEQSRSQAALTNWVEQVFLSKHPEIPVDWHRSVKLLHSKIDENGVGQSSWGLSIRDGAISWDYTITTQDKQQYIRDSCFRRNAQENDAYFMKCLNVAKEIALRIVNEANQGKPFSKSNDESGLDDIKEYVKTNISRYIELGYRNADDQHPLYFYCVKEIMNKKFHLRWLSWRELNPDIII